MAETKSIKLQIMERIVARLQGGLMGQSGDVTNNQSVRSVARELNPLKNSEALPALMVYDGDESEVPGLKKTQGRTYQFPVTVKVLIESPIDLPGTTDRLVAEVQRIMETEIQLDGGGAALCDIVDGGSVQPFLNDLESPNGGAFVTYTVQYRRTLGNPYTTFG